MSTRDINYLILTTNRQNNFNLLKKSLLIYGPISLIWRLFFNVLYSLNVFLEWFCNRCVVTSSIDYFDA